MNRIEAVVESLGIKIASKRGNRGWAHCPFHNSEHPTTFFIRLSGNRAGNSHCFSCKGGGGLAELVMHIRGCDYETARAFVSSIGRGFNPPRARVAVASPPPNIGRRKFKMPKEVIFEPLEYWISTAKRYAVSREITQEDIDLFRIGYAVDGELSCRIVIPWLGRNNLVAGFSARSFVDTEPKYKTPKESDNADFGVMVGEHLWPETHRRGVCVVTEGALNALAVRRVLPKANISLAALGGSEINPTHIIKLSTFGLVIVMTDPDSAGDKAAKVIESSLTRHTPTRRLRLPEGKDALDVGPKYLRNTLETALRGCI